MSGFVVTDNGRMVDTDTERIAAIIKDYDPRLELAWIEPERRSDPTDHEFPFAVMYDNPATGRKDLVFRLRSNEIDHRILKRLWESDNKNGNVLDAIEAEEAARKAVELKRQMDEHEAKQELAEWMIKAPVGAKLGNGRVLR